MSEENMDDYDNESKIGFDLLAHIEIMDIMQEAHQTNLARC